MSDYRRYFVPGATYFFTVVAERRAKLFADSAARRLLGSVMRRCFHRYAVEVIAVVLLEDHLHTLWTLPPADDSYSLRWRWIKREFSRAWLARSGVEQPRAPSRRRERRRGVWQRRFWEHTIRDEADLEAHFDYIHYNPVKHGLVHRRRTAKSGVWLIFRLTIFDSSEGRCPKNVPDPLSRDFAVLLGAPAARLALVKFSSLGS